MDMRNRLMVTWSLFVLFFVLFFGHVLVDTSRFLCYFNERHITFQTEFTRSRPRVQRHITFSTSRSIMGNAHAQSSDGHVEFVCSIFCPIFRPRVTRHITFSCVISMGDTSRFKPNLPDRPIAHAHLKTPSWTGKSRFLISD